MTSSDLLAAGSQFLIAEAAIETPWLRRTRVMSACKTWEFDAYRVLAAGGLCDRDPVRDAEYADYLRWRSEYPRSTVFRPIVSSSSQCLAPVWSSLRRSPRLSR